MSAYSSDADYTENQFLDYMHMAFAEAQRRREVPQTPAQRDAAIAVMTVVVDWALLTGTESVLVGAIATAGLTVAAPVALALALSAVGLMWLSESQREGLKLVRDATNPLSLAVGVSMASGSLLGGADAVGTFEEFKLGVRLGGILDFVYSAPEDIVALSTMEPLRARMLHSEKLALRLTDLASDIAGPERALWSDADFTNNGFAEVGGAEKRVANQLDFDRTMFPPEPAQPPVVAVVDGGQQPKRKPQPPDYSRGAPDPIPPPKLMPMPPPYVPPKYLPAPSLPPPPPTPHFAGTTYIPAPVIPSFPIDPDDWVRP